MHNKVITLENNSWGAKISYLHKYVQKVQEADLHAHFIKIQRKSTQMDASEH